MRCRVTDDLSRQLLARARQVAQFLDRLWRHETRADQAVSQQFGDPGRVVHVALAARHVANVRGVGQDQREPAMKNVPDGLPVDTRRLHRHVRDLAVFKPVRQFEQAAGRGRETADLRLNLAPGDKPPTRHYLLLVHVQSRAPSMHRLHHALPSNEVAGVMP
jgi:hypothetical protein